jgi:capsular exopolysaccharide synthesis family protein
MDLRSYLRAVRRRWWLVLIVIVLGAVGGVVQNIRATPLYASHLTFYVSTPASTNGNALESDQFAQHRTATYVELLSSEKLADRVIADADLPLTRHQVMGEISGTAKVNTVLLVATVRDPIPARSLKIANAVASLFPAMIDELDNTTTKTSTVRLSVVSGPTLLHSPVSPRKKLNIGVGLLIGLLVGLVLAVVRELTDTSIRSAEVVREAVGLPTIGHIQFDTAAKSSALIAGGHVHSRSAEAFRQLRTNLQFADVDHPVRVIMVTSSVAAEGKSTTAANLAIVFAETGRRVLLIEADLRRPRVSEYLGLDRVIGLTNVLAGQVAIDEVLQHSGPDALTVLPSGTLPPNPSELLGSRNMVDLISAMRQRFDTVIIDTPPLLPVTDAAVVSVLADGVVVVVRHGKTSRADLLSAVRSLDAVDAHVLGCVLNMEPAKKSGKDRGSYDGYGYYEDPAAPIPMAGDRAPINTPPDQRDSNNHGAQPRGAGRRFDEESVETRELSVQPRPLTRGRRMRGT